MSDEPKRVLLSWSSGKDSAWTLQVLRRQADVKVVGLLTTFNRSANRVAMHAVRRQLAESQAHATALPLISVELPWPCPNEAYERAMQAALESAVNSLGIRAVAFGDLYLSDIRNYREHQMAAWDLEPLFPLWHSPTDALAREMIRNGLKAIVTCVDPKQCPREFSGRFYDLDFLTDLPPNVDPCGENGEFHTFACDGPMFAQPVPVARGEITERDGFVFADLKPEAGIPMQERL